MSKGSESYFFERSRTSNPASEVPSLDVVQDLRRAGGVHDSARGGNRRSKVSWFMDLLRSKRSVQPKDDTSHLFEQPHGAKHVSDSPARYVLPQLPFETDICIFDEGGFKQEVKLLEQDIDTAICGRKRFKQSYWSGSPAWRNLITSETAVGAAIRALYLGLKPMIGFGIREEKEHKCLLQDHAEEDFYSLLQDHAKEDFHVIDTYVFNENSVRKVLTDPRYSHYFDDYTPGSSPAYISTLISSLSKRNWCKEDDMKFGLLYGYPPKAVEQFIKYKDEKVVFLDEWSKKERQLSKRERALLAGYRYGEEAYKLYISDTFDEKRDEKILFDVINNISHDSENKFKEGHEPEIRALLEEKFADLDYDVIDYIASERVISIFGMSYTSHKQQGPSDKRYRDRSLYILERSGMNEFLAFLKQT